jgi:hypothetical protein
MKNKNTVTNKDTYSYQEVAAAAKIIQEWYTTLASRQEPGSQMSKDFNFVRLEMNNLRQVLAD